MRSAKLFVCSIALLPAACAQALAEKQDFFNLKISADYGNSDNATLVSDQEPRFSERQGLYTALAGIRYNNDWSNLSSNYRLQRETFERDSQPNLTEFEGRTQLIFGNDFYPLGLTLSHDRRAMLNAPDAIDLTSNRDTRDIVSVAPSVKARIGDADALMIMGSYTDISYKEDEFRQSEQQGGQLAWIHGISKTDQFQVDLQQIETTFDKVSSANYKLQTASAGYGVALKRLKYSLRVGYNKAISESSNKDFASPVYQFESSYDSGFNIFSLSLSQTITDSSSIGGAGSLDNFSPGASVPSSKGVGLDLINLRNATLAWTTEAICERCSFGVNASQMKQDYKDLREDGDEYSLSAHLSYKLSRASSVKLSTSHRERKFSDTAVRAGFDADITRISLGHDLMGGFQLELYAQQEKRSSKISSQNYKENIAGVKVTYDFK
ncbi:hypothetical protein [Cellvibrio sp.]|uniref:hypothetical protein n=1 Tax=Cellvibrio sp. TaxID=1965322 RepID=UPI0039648C5F